MSSKALAQTQDKALQLNLASTIYGTFAEIGAGQETANWFFRASGAAGTVAKTISAYDMTVSDTLYGPVKRYVSEERLKGMLDYEFTQLVNHDNLLQILQGMGALLQQPGDATMIARIITAARIPFRTVFPEINC